MLGFRGASRYSAHSFAGAFGLECAALVAVRDTMGLSNVEVMIPFVRTPEELARVLDTMKAHGLERGAGADREPPEVTAASNVPSRPGLKIHIMCGRVPGRTSPRC